MPGRAPIILAIAGSDSSGGAGLAADLLAAEALGAKLRWAVTAVTAQTDQSVGAVHDLPPALVRRQIDMALADGAVRSAKLGMLGNAACVATVADALRDFAERRPVVIDPVLMASSGAALLDEAGVTALIEKLLPMAALVTPNLPELEHLALCLGAAPGDSVARQAAFVMRAGARAVLVKGGHASGPEAADLLFERHQRVPRHFSSPRVAARLRGTGCRLATAIAVRLARGDDLAAACAFAKSYLFRLLTAEAAERPAEALP
jgi:hydroxymethylpyrimidine/phosphomethylpyrimidine kinase